MVGLKVFRWPICGIQINDKESVFLIQDMFPITEEYIERTYTIANNHLTVTSEHSAIEIEKKAKKVMHMLKKGVKFTPTQPDINAIINKLIQIWKLFSKENSFFVKIIEKNI